MQCCELLVKITIDFMVLAGCSTFLSLTLNWNTTAKSPTYMLYICMYCSSRTVLLKTF